MQKGLRRETVYAVSFLLMLSLLLSSCSDQSEVKGKQQGNPKTPLRALSAGPNETAARGGTDAAWQRMKECAEQAARIAQRLEERPHKDFGIMGWENHYSPKYERCYVLVKYLNREATKNRNLPLLFDQLFDAFESRALAICTNSSATEAGTFCSVEPRADGSPEVDCGNCAQFIKDRMNN
jgi:hypothetical protein